VSSFFPAFENDFPSFGLFPFSEKQASEIIVCVSPFQLFGSVG
jgi:hypothetical protein